MAAKSQLTNKQRLFVEHYFECGLNGTEAASLAGYKGDRATLASIASENLRKPKIAQLITERLKERTMSANEVLYRLTEQARGTMEDFVTPALDSISLIKAESRGRLHLVKKFTHTVGEKSEHTAIELYDAQAALVQLGRAHGLFKDKTETDVHVSGDVGGTADDWADAFKHAQQELAAWKHERGMDDGDSDSTPDGADS